MSEVGILVLLYALGVVILLTEIFIPSHGILTIAGMGFLAAAVVKTFDHGGRQAGVVAVFACLVFLPTLAFFAVKYWRQTPIGRRIAPPNPVLTPEHAGVPLQELGELLGRTGRATTPLRPVGIGDFDGRRVSCIAESGMIEAGVAIKGIGISGANLMVTEKNV